MFNPDSNLEEFLLTILTIVILGVIVLALGAITGMF